jgi:hypothetical protein
MVLVIENAKLLSIQQVLCFVEMLFCILLACLRRCQRKGTKDGMTG